MKHLLTLAFVTFSFISFSQISKVSGEITNPSGEFIYLYSFPINNGKPSRELIDSLKLSNGKFETKLKIDSLTQIQFSDGNETTSFFINSDESLHLTLNTPFFDESIRFSGSAAPYNTYIQIGSISQEMTFLTIDYFKGIMTYEDTSYIFEEVATLGDKLIKYFEDGVDTYPVIKRILLDRTKGLKRHFGGIKNDLMFDLNFKTMEEKAIGQKFLDFTGIDLKGKEHKLSEYKGKPVVIDFWATWCGPCKVEMPYLHKIEKEYGEKIQVLQVCVFDKKESWKTKAEGLGAGSSLFIGREDFNPVMEKYMIKFIPRFVLLDENGVVVEIQAGRPSSGLREQIDLVLK